MGPTTKLEGRRKNSLLRLIGKTATVHGLIFSLLMAPLHAQTNALHGVQGNQGHWVNTLNNIINTTANSYMQSQQGSIAARLAAQQMSSLRPRVIPARFFPQCRISQASTAFPENVCQSPVSGPAELARISAFKQLATSYKGFFEQMLSPAQNSSFPVGFQCLDEARSKQASELQDALDELERFATQIKKANQQFRDNARAQLREMSEINKELTGRGVNDIDSQTTPFASYFDESCQNIIGQEALNRGPDNGGLNGIRQSLEGTRKTAADYAGDQTKLEKELDAQIKTIAKDIKNQGIEPWLAANGSTPVTGYTTFAGMTDAIQREFRRLNINKDLIEREVKKVDPGFSIPTLDQNFAVDFGEFERGAGEYFQKRYINECATFTEYGVGLSISEVLKSLRQEGVAGGDIIPSYRETLGNILREDSTIEDKLTKIYNKLESKYKDHKVVIKYKDSEANIAKESIYDLLQKTIKACQEKFVNNETFAPSSTEGGNVSKAKSQQKQVERAKNYLNDLKTLEKTFLTDLQNAMRDQIVNCNGVEKKANTCSSDGAVFDTSRNEFCFAHASACATEVSSCYNQAKQEVEKRTQQIKTKAAEYNAFVENFIAGQEATLKQVQFLVENQAKALERFFPNSDFKFPADLLVEMPGMNRAADMGVDLRGGLDFESIAASLPEKIASLKDALEDQKEAVNNEIERYVQNQREAMEQNRSKWEGLLDDCHGVENDYFIAQAKQQQEAIQAQQEQFGEINTFCHNYSRLREVGPGPGCEGDTSPSKLYGEAAKIAAYITHDALYSIKEYDKVCGYHKATSESDNEDDEDIKPGLAQACQDSANSWTRVISKLKNSLLDSLPAEFAEEEREIAKYLEDKDKDLEKVLGKELFNTSFAGAIENLHSLIHKAEGLSKEEFKKDVESKVTQEKEKPERGIASAGSHVKLKSGSNKNLCHYFENQKEFLAFEYAIENDKCKDNTFRKCMRDERKNIEDEDVLDGELSEIDRSIASIASAVSRASKGSSLTLQREWSEIGQRTSDACQAGSGNSRNFASRLEEHLQGSGLNVQGFGGIGQQR